MEKYSSPMENVDILVVGGGVAGLAAAISAAATGAKTLLIEKSDLLGGNIALANVHTFCGLYDVSQEHDFKYLNAGFTPWFVENLRKFGGALSPEKHGRVGVLPIFPAKMAEFALNTVKAFPTLTVMLETNLIALKIENTSSSPSRAAVMHKGEEYLISAKTVIDSSGDAMAAALSGAELSTPEPDELQNATLIFRIAGANANDLIGYSRLKLSAAIARGAASGAIPADCEAVLARPGENSDEAYISLNLPKLDDHIFAPLDKNFMRIYEQYAHNLALTLIAFLKENLPGWSKCQLLEWPRLIGVRETRHIVGQYIMTEKDVLTGATFSDAVARSIWPIELWHKHTGADFKYPENISDIPLRSLISQSHPNLGMAGRCMSGTHTALGALRISGTAMATGEAVGIAASIATERGISLAEVSCDDVKTHHKKLIGTVFKL